MIHKCSLFCVQFRLLFHGPIHLDTEEMTVILPATLDPYNTVGYLELIVGKLHLNLLTNCMYMYIIVLVRREIVLGGSCVHGE